MTRPIRISMQRGLCWGALWGCLFTLGCAEDVTAVLGTERPYALYGLFTPQLDTQWVRVFSVEDRLEPVAPQPLDARFTSTDLQSGEVWVWKDSLIQEADGMYAHVFWSPFRAAFGHTYRVRVERSDGLASYADAIVPPAAEIVLEEPSTTGQVVLPVFVKGEVPRLLKVEVVYGFDFKYNTAVSDKIDTLVVAYDGAQEKVEGGWRIRINLSRDFETVRDAIRRGGPLDLGYGILLTGITLRMLAASEAWDPPGGVFDPEVLVEPGTLSNVANGFGLVAAGFRVRRVWLPASEVLEAAGFRPR